MCLVGLQANSAHEIIFFTFSVMRLYWTSQSKCSSWPQSSADWGAKFCLLSRAQWLRMGLTGEPKEAIYTFSFFPCPPQSPLPLWQEHVHVTSIWPIKCPFLRPRIGNWSFRGAEMRSFCGCDCNNVQFPGPAGGTSNEIGFPVPRYQLQVMAPIAH